MERTQWKEKQIEELEHRCENIYMEGGIKNYITDLIEQAVAHCGTIYPHTMTFKAEYEECLKANKILKYKLKFVESKLAKIQKIFDMD